jgi:hypothetical protein
MNYHHRISQFLFFFGTSTCVASTFPPTSCLIGIDWLSVFRLIGLPSGHISYVKNVKPGMPLFLFNYSDRKMHGIFEAACAGKLNIDQFAWSDGGRIKTQFPAQVSSNNIPSIYVAS